MLKDRVAIVTGSTSGIGLAIAKKLAANGAHIMLNGFGDMDAIETIREQLVSDYGIKAAYHPADMTEPSEIRDLVETTVSEFGGVDILVNNAGIQFTGKIETYPEEKWDAIIAINLSSSFHTTKAVIPHMKGKGYGRIVNIASAHGLVASPNKGAYVAAKHGLVGFTKVTAIELAGEGITANAVCPGWVNTPLVDKQVDDRAKESGRDPEEEARLMIGEKQPLQQFTSPEQIGDATVFFCQESSSTITGTTLSVDGGWTCW